jgi:hypothetical protein
MNKIEKQREEMRKIGQIIDAIGVVFTAHCEKCGIEHSDNTDEDVFAEKLNTAGWRCDTIGDLYCPDCAKKLKIK